MAEVADIRRCLKSFDFENLFIEILGWDRHHAHLDVTIEGTTFSLDAVAEKRGFQVFLCQLAQDQPFPDAATCSRIQREVAKSAHENLILFVDHDQTRQSWKWAKREIGNLLRSRGADLHKGQSGEALAQRLSNLAITLDEEQQEGFSLVDVTQRVRAAFDVDRVTKQFYNRFREEHKSFLGFIKGIKEITDREWYASLMLNRLMFVYFIQKKGFLDGDLNYLQNRLQQTKALKGKDKFHSFYRYFLLRLFHEGFGQREEDRPNDLEALIGSVPYLNGGLFDVHVLEHDNPEIQIADAAFEKLFEFFDQYQWHLDDRPLRNDTEINPDVLGYIFEKYINQKQMGAYYTKEDITDYISKNTIIPYLFDAAAKRCAVGLQTGSAAWQLLVDDPDRYIYDAVGHGIFVDIQTGKRLDQPIALPPEIEAGIDDVSQRGEWNRPAPPELALPTETWREHIARRQRCLELREKLAGGEVTTINDLVTLNLNIRQFAQDVIENCEGPELLRAIYYTIAGRMPQKSNEQFQRGISVLDPTCGSGAFLFAALNILQPLYEACLDRMAQFVLEQSEYAAQATPEEELDALIAQGESKTLEFKETARWDVKQGKANKEMEKVIVKAVAAMLNSEGGDLLIGMHDSGTATGIEVDYKLMGKQGSRDGYENWLTTLLVQNNFGKQTAPFVNISFVQRDGKDVCRVSVQPSPTAVYVKEENDERIYILAGNSTRLLTAKEAIEYHKHRFDDAAPTPKPKTTTKASKDPRRFPDFRSILKSVDSHPSREYFILKSIIINNLFGVDIMAEAVEICKLRLFLQLVSTIEDVNHLEPLPDIDFNIRAGNTLVGIATLEQVKEAASKDTKGQGKIVFSDVDEEIERISESAELVGKQFQMFRRQQTDLGGTVTAEDKQALRDKLQSLTDKLNQYLAKEYGINPTKPRQYQKWLQSHQPFHWFVEFYGIMSQEGFDVIIGNPPYIVYPSSKVGYRLEPIAFKTLPTKNLYDFVFERSLGLATSRGPVGLIVQLTVISSSKQLHLQNLLLDRSGFLVLPFPRRPESMFDGVEMPVAIVLSIPGFKSSYHTSRVGRIYSEERSHVLDVTRLESHLVRKDDCRIAKFGTSMEQDLYLKLASCILCVDELSAQDSSHLVYYQEACRYWVKASRGLPYFTRNGEEMAPPHGRTINFMSRDAAAFVTCLLNSSLFYWYYTIFSDCEHVNDGLLRTMPVPDQWDSIRWTDYSRELMKSLSKSASRKTINTKQGHVIVYDEMKASLSKAIIDEVDEALASVFGLNEAEVDFLKNFDIKYRTATDNDSE